MSSKKAVIIDYGVGNIRSIIRCIKDSEKLTGKSVEVELTKDPSKAKSCDFLVLPGVGSYQGAAEQLEPWREELHDIIRNGKPTFAVCLGMQLLFETSEEGQGQGLGLGLGLGVFKGNVTKLKAKQIPQMGWNKINHTNADYQITDWAYFAHSYAVRPVDESIIAGTTKYEDDVFPSIIRTPTILATQFHPEKSDVVGIELVQRFMKEVFS